MAPEALCGISRAWHPAELRQAIKSQGEASHIRKVVSSYLHLSTETTRRQISRFVILHTYIRPMRSVEGRQGKGAREAGKGRGQGEGPRRGVHR